MEEKQKRMKRKFTEEFKREAIALGNKLGPSAASRELGLYESQIRCWRKKFEVGPSSSTSSDKKGYSELEKENKRLAKENGYLKEINKVLKKSTAIFCSDQLGGVK